MDKVQANLFARQLIEEGHVDEWRLTCLLGHGKSAVVMHGEHSGKEAAIKVFHPELIERYGLEPQMLRIERERALIGQSHPNTVSILGGGVSSPHGHPYVAMSVERGAVLSECLKKIDPNGIRKIIEQLASAAKYLEDLGLVHRDIKPDNIIVTDVTAGSIKLLDFGVIRPFGDSTATDQPGHTPFVGTHQYSPPEMLHRREKQTLDGWRAITFYQIGAVLHDLINREPIFLEDREPYADLVIAVDSKIPSFPSPDSDPDLVGLARKCLLKDPLQRLRLVKWDDFFFSTHKVEKSIDDRKARLAQMQKIRVAESPRRSFEINEENRLARIRLSELSRTLKNKVDAVLDSLSENLPPRLVESSQDFYPNPTLHCEFTADKSLGVLRPFHIQLSIKLTNGTGVVELFVRAEKGETGNEIGWHALGPYLDDLSGLDARLSDWMLEILEELIIN